MYSRSQEQIVKTQALRLELDSKIVERDKEDEKRWKT